MDNSSEQKEKAEKQDCDESTHTEGRAYSKHMFNLIFSVLTTYGLLRLDQNFLTSLLQYFCNFQGGLLVSAILAIFILLSIAHNKRNVIWEGFLLSFFVATIYLCLKFEVWPIILFMVIYFGTDAAQRRASDNHKTKTWGKNNWIVRTEALLYQNRVRLGLVVVYAFIFTLILTGIRAGLTSQDIFSGGHDNLILIRILTLAIAPFAVLCAFHATKENRQLYLLQILVCTNISHGWLENRPSYWMFALCAFSLYLSSKSGQPPSTVKQKKIYLNRENLINYIKNLIVAFAKGMDRPQTSNSGVDHADTNLALVGPWGTGKTFILERIIEKLQKENQELNLVIANPWNAHNAKDAEQKLVKAVITAICGKDSLSYILEQHPALKKLRNIIPNELASMYDLFSAYLESNQTESIEKLAEELDKKIKKTVVLFIDDMDRALPEVIKAIFPVIDRICKVSKIIVVAALDLEALKNAYGNGAIAEGHMRKVFPYQYIIPEASDSELEEMAQEMIFDKDCALTSAVIKGQYNILPHEKKNKTIKPKTPRGLIQITRMTAFLEKLLMKDRKHEYDKENTKQTLGLFYSMECLRYDFPLEYAELQSSAKSQDYFDPRITRQTDSNEKWHKDFPKSSKAINSDEHFKDLFSYIVEHCSSCSNTAFSDDLSFSYGDIDNILSGNLFKFANISTGHAIKIAKRFSDTPTPDSLSNTIREVVGLEYFNGASIEKEFWIKLTKTVTNDFDKNGSSEIPLLSILNILKNKPQTRDEDASLQILRIATLYEGDKHKNTRNSISLNILNSLDVEKLANLLMNIFCYEWLWWGDEKNTRNKLKEMIEPNVVKTCIEKLFPTHKGEIPKDISDLLAGFGKALTKANIEESQFPQCYKDFDKLMAHIYLFSHTLLSSTTPIEKNYYYLHSPLFPFFLNIANSATEKELRAYLVPSSYKAQFLYSLYCEYDTNIKNTRLIYEKDREFCSEKHAKCLMHQLDTVYNKLKRLYSNQAEEKTIQ